MSDLSQLMAVHELKHSIGLYLQLMGGYTDGVGVLCTKMVDVVDDLLENKDITNEVLDISSKLIESVRCGLTEKLKEYDADPQVKSTLELLGKLDSGVKSGQLRGLRFVIEELHRVDKSAMPEIIPIRDSKGRII